jgi:asparagine synthase (glutamine-hydrolysing)
MCGIWAWIHAKGVHVDTNKILKAVEHIVARGPEGTRIQEIVGDAKATFAFTRLAINGLNPDGMQPFTQGSASATWMCNGEIYNSRQIEAALGYVSKSGSDCEVLGELWSASKAYNGSGSAVTFCRALDGVFSLVLYDAAANEYVVARDPYGVRPLYWSEDKFRGTMFASERKALEGFVEGYAKICEFPPGEVWRVNSEGIVSKSVYHMVPWLKGVFSGEASILSAVRDSFLAAVRKRLMTERPVAALLSGGLDSSLVAACVQKMLMDSGAAPLKTFSIGMRGSSDLKYARLVAGWIKSDHHEILVTADEMFAAIPDVIRDIESYDITTVRASVGNWLVAREIRRRTQCKVVFNGDGSDEVWGSYLYFYKAPNDYAFEAETVRLLTSMHRYDVLRSDRSISSHGLEARTPFLDKQFVGVAMSVPTELRRPVVGGRVEKDLLRRAFAGTDYLPADVLWRTKEAFSDGVSTSEKSWFQEIQERILERGLVPWDWEKLANKYPSPIPITAESFYYRSLYESMYKKTGDYWPYWMPQWSPETTDPSARTLAVYSGTSSTKEDVALDSPV